MEKTIIVSAECGELDKVISFIENEMNGCSAKHKMQLNIAVEEIFVNIAHYAYHPKKGNAEISVDIKDNPLSVSVKFTDSGKPYNPLENSDPDTTLSAEERSIGGLGVYMVKKSMDNVEYEYRDGKNILTITKNL